MSRRILLVEDNADIATLLEFHLADLGYTVAIEVDGDTASRRLNREAFDLLILDWMLPGKDGLDICRELRARGSRFDNTCLAQRSRSLTRDCVYRGLNSKNGNSCYAYS